MSLRKSPDGSTRSRPSPDLGRPRSGRSAAECRGAVKADFAQLCQLGDEIGQFVQVGRCSVDLQVLESDAQAIADSIAGDQIAGQIYLS